MTQPVVPSIELAIPSLQEALAVSISCGSFVDTAYYLFSRRTADYRVGHPRVVYANSRVLKITGDYFIARPDDNVLRTEFYGGLSADDEIPDATDDYGYESDSDLEEVAEHDSEQTESGSKGKGKASDKTETDSTISSLREEVKCRGVKNSLFVPDVAAVTTPSWQALVFFIYTGKISFAPLRSNGLQARRAALEEHHRIHPELPPLCSPKSMFRLADIVGLTVLKTLAVQEIQKQLSVSCLTDELFSQFSARYLDVLQVQLDFMYGCGRMTQVMQKIQLHVASIVNGAVPHTDAVLLALLLKLSEVLLLNPAPFQAMPILFKFDRRTEEGPPQPKPFKFKFPSAGPSVETKQEPGCSSQ
ncbi:uncharacterized protein PHACADRAFT_188902 [Phanerochaete carnosa HHB-10118-sp]|uniref:BTB domain-containing protein n=1 Tax=Phanerochaete carnosa (strain HHB-10118-sp) TaxID=650164 RepID=K5UK00_PHACS|nr:uncharacterized protein PHACADRAFT_188902 [Phanerochaete carnosa HHB-10118-sp]EKM49896.1 hypothetical protein PHACADRAFT_188902 [Phanerochaete carnosa HHB-10118-sp]